MMKNEVPMALGPNNTEPQLALQGPQFTGTGLSLKNIELRRTEIVVVQRPQSRQRAVYIPTSPPTDYSCLAAMVCLCCFLPTGVIALAYTNEVVALVQRGDYARAHQVARWVRNLIIASIVIGVSIYTTIFLCATLTIYTSFKDFANIADPE